MLKKNPILKLTLTCIFLFLILLILYNRFNMRLVLGLTGIWSLFFIYQKIIANVFLYKDNQYARERWFLAYMIGWGITCTLNLIILKMVI